MVPTIFAFIGFKMYQNNVTLFEQHAKDLKKVEDKFITQAKSNVELTKANKLSNLSIQSDIYNTETNMIKL